MVARSIGSGTISFGLVSIPVRLYVATRSEQLSFNMLEPRAQVIDLMDALKASLARRRAATPRRRTTKK